MSNMDKIFRVSAGREIFYAVERAGEFSRASLDGGDLFTGFSPGGPLPRGLDGLTLLAPVEPSTIICVGLNYREHISEMDKAAQPEPLLFLKPTTTVLNPGEAIVLPPGVGRVDHEAELA